MDIIWTKGLALPIDIGTAQTYTWDWADLLDRTGGDTVLVATFAANTGLTVTNIQIESKKVTALVSCDASAVHGCVLYVTARIETAAGQKHERTIAFEVEDL